MVPLGKTDHHHQFQNTRLLPDDRMEKIKMRQAAAVHRKVRSSPYTGIAKSRLNLEVRQS